MQKPSYTEQAKQWTARAADNLHGQAEYLKTKVVGTPGSTTVCSDLSGLSCQNGTLHAQILLFLEVIESEV